LCKNTKSAFFQPAGFSPIRSHFALAEMNHSLFRGIYFVSLLGYYRHSTSAWQQNLSGLREAGF
jgi:hypothetical protein